METLRVAARWCLCVGALLLGFIWFRTVPAAGGQGDQLAARGLLAARTVPAVPPQSVAVQPGLVKLTPAAEPIPPAPLAPAPAPVPRPAAVAPPARPAPSAATGRSASTPQPERRRGKRICRITAYCDRGTTACGVQSGVGQCAAPADLPFGTRIHIPALNRTLVVTDRTHKRFRHNTVDIFMPSYTACMKFGVKYLQIEYELPPSKKKR